MKDAPKTMRHELVLGMGRVSVKATAQIEVQTARPFYLARLVIPKRCAENFLITSMYLRTEGGESDADRKNLMRHCPGAIPALLYSDEVLPSIALEPLLMEKGDFFSIGLKNLSDKPQDFIGGLVGLAKPDDQI